MKDDSAYSMSNAMRLRQVRSCDARTKRFDGPIATITRWTASYGYGVKVGGSRNIPVGHFFGVTHSKARKLRGLSGNCGSA